MATKPELSVWVGDYYKAFHVLKESRQILDGGIGPIPLSEIEAYVRLYRIDDLDERERLVRMIRALDSVYIKHVNESSKRERDGRRVQHSSRR